MTLVQVSTGRGEFAAADGHVAAVEQLAEGYEQPLTLAITAWYHGLRHLVAGPPRPIRRDYAYDLWWTVRGLLGVAIDDLDRVATAYRHLLPHADLLAGAGSRAGDRTGRAGPRRARRPPR